jgi:hypothetical protein
MVIYLHSTTNCTQISLFIIMVISKEQILLLIQQYDYPRSG